MGFMSEADFETCVAEQKEIISWKEVPIGKIYAIESMEKMDTKEGPATVVNLEDKEGKSLKAFATSVLAKDLEEKNGKLFIKSLGLKESKNGRKYYNYELVMEKSTGC